MKTTNKMEVRNIDDLIPYQNNTRTHDKKQIAKIRSSLREFGFVNPVLIDSKNGIIAGHGRVLAAREEGITDIPCVLVEHLTEAQKKAYIIADNRLALDAGWDEELLKIELEGLSELDFDLLLTGFDAKELEVFMLDINDLGTSFDLASGDKEPIQQITFTLADEQAEFIRYSLSMIDEYTETFGNQNKNGNALYEVIKQWAEQRK